MATNCPEYEKNLESCPAPVWSASGVATVASVSKHMSHETPFRLTRSIWPVPKTDPL